MLPISPHCSATKRQVSTTAISRLPSSVVAPTQDGRTSALGTCPHHATTNSPVTKLPLTTSLHQPPKPFPHLRPGPYYTSHATLPHRRRRRLRLAHARQRTRAIPTHPPPDRAMAASTAFAAAKFLPSHLDSSPRIAPHRAGPTANLSFAPLSSSSFAASLLRLRSPSPSGPGGRLPPPPPPRSYGGAGSGDAADSGGNDGGSRGGGILGVFLAGWAARVAADPQFPFKVLMEELVGVTACVLGDMASRPNFGLNELDFVFSTLVVGSILNFVLMYLLAPTAGVAAAASSAASALPSHMFEPGAYSLGSRVATIVSKGATFAAVGFAAGLAGTAISNGLIAMRKRMDPAFETPNKAPPTLLNAATWALHMGVSSNLRYQTLNGVEYLLGKVAPAPVFKVSVVALRCMNNVLGGMSFVLLARLTGAQKSDKPATAAEEKERLIAVGNAAADAINVAKDGEAK
ncbi:hypothetical protein HU200_025895 [Digitaria exilis]|uniref:Protein RETICULATA-RELATED 3, chloroplastic n=1 Tax=Digitaria exilis TaxID=1010633 RepID=A0A835C9F7_9POAL|nr:hypothetical protein HU200_025895 [Digitaria exilis]